MKIAGPMPLDAFDLARRQARIEGQAPLAQLSRLADSLAAPEGELHYAIEGWVDPQGRHGARLELTADLALVCQRCGEILTWRLARKGDFRFVRTEAEVDDVPLDDDALDAVVTSGAIDVLAWIEDEAILSLPLVPRHAACRMQYKENELGSSGLAQRTAGAFASLASLRPKPGRAGPT
jgi:uncharacterized protein